MFFCCLLFSIRPWEQLQNSRHLMFEWRTLYLKKDLLVASRLQSATSANYRKKPFSFFELKCLFDLEIWIWHRVKNKIWIICRLSWTCCEYKCPSSLTSEMFLSSQLRLKWNTNDVQSVGLLWHHAFPIVQCITMSQLFQFFPFLFPLQILWLCFYRSFSKLHHHLLS